MANTSTLVAKNFLFLSIGEAVSRVLGVGISVYVARYLGQGVFGSFVFATAFISFFNLFVDLGLTSLGVREIASAPAPATTNRFGSHILFLQTSLALGLLVLLLVIDYFLPINLTAKILVAMFGLNMIPNALNMTYIFQAHQRMEYIALVRIISQLGYVVLGFLLIILVRNIVVLPIALAITATLGSYLGFWWLKKQLGFRLVPIERAESMRLMRLSLPFLVSSVAIQLYTNLDSVLLQFFKGEVVVGLYNAPYKLIILLVTAGNLLAGTLLPLLASRTTDRQAFERIVTYWARINGVVIFPVVVIVWIYAGWLLDLVYTSAYHHATTVFQILICIPLFSFLTLVLINPLIALNHQQYWTKAVVYGALLNLGLNVLLIPSYGMVGAAAASVAAEALVLIILSHYFRQHVTIPVLWDYVVYPAIASGCMGGVMYISGLVLSPIPSIAIGLVVYAGVLLLFGGISVKEVRLLMGMLGRRNSTATS